MKLTKNNGTKIKNNSLQIALLISLILNALSIYRIYNLEEQMKFNHSWMIIKRIRAELIEERLTIIEKKLNIKHQRY